MQQTRTQRLETVAQWVGQLRGVSEPAQSVEPAPLVPERPKRDIFAVFGGGGSSLEICIWI